MAGPQPAGFVPDGFTPDPAPVATMPEGFKPDAPTFSTSNEKDAAGNATVDPNSVSTFVRHLWTGINPVQVGQLLPFPKALGGSGMENPLFPQNLVKQMHAVKLQADALWDKGDKVGASAKYVESVIPLLGPMLSQQGDEWQQGKYAAAAGDTAAMATNAALMTRGATKAPAQAKVAAEATPAEAAVQWGKGEGLPIDAGTATGNVAVKGSQFMADRTLAGSLVATPQAARSTAAYAAKGEQLASDARGVAVQPEQAGQAVRDALTSKLQAHTDLMTHAYDQLETLEQQTPLPVTTTAAKAALKPVYEQMQRQMPVTQQQASPGLKAIANILDGPDVAPLSQVDRDLSTIKALARDHGGLAKFAAGKLNSAVLDAAMKGGPDVVRALNTGRQAKIAQVGTQELIDALPGGKLEEPVAVFKRATAPQDGGIEFLRAVQEQTPQALPQIARAKLDDLLTMKPDKAQAEWSNLGTQTRKVLFPQAGQSQALDHFFLLQKTVNENMNPSGSGVVAMHVAELGTLWANPTAFVAAQVGGAGLATILHTRLGVQALTRLLSLRLKAPGAPRLAQLAAATQLERAASAAGVPLTLPVGAQGPTPSETAQPGSER